MADASTVLMVHGPTVLAYAECGGGQR